MTLALLIMDLNMKAGCSLCFVSFSLIEVNVNYKQDYLEINVVANYIM